MRVNKQTKTGRQQAEIFRLIFQESKSCKMFRIRWGIPAKGFKNRNDYYKWNNELNKEINEYHKSNKYKKYREEIKRKKIEQAEGKIRQFDLDLFVQNIVLRDPYYKLEHDISWITLKSSKPIYWRDFIEQCLFFENPDICFPDKPLPTPKLEWNSKYQFYELVIKNIFPDTDAKDFTNRYFLREFEKLKIGLPGFNNLKPRHRKDLDFGLKLIEIDRSRPYLSDFEKYEEITDEDWARKVNLKQERKIKDKVRQARIRINKLLGLKK